MKLLQISILAHSLHAEKNCRGKNEETRKHNSDVQRQSTQVSNYSTSQCK